ncbi:MAG: hypothetical protein AUK31_04125 [Fibrobacteres bacterium CG2_30_45_31]|nr:MAG: hypothetical protein AUK31_04125 [Fibrobacteres bacterium CG2_30_45_31]
MSNKSPYFQSGFDDKLPKIFGASVFFHIIVIGVLIAINQVHFSEPPQEVKVFELVQLQKPATPQVRHRRPRPKPQVKPEVKKEVKPVERPLPPEPKLAKAKAEPAPPTPPEPEEEEEDTDDSPLEDDMDLPSFTEESSLNPVGSVDMDPLMQVYLERLKQIIMQHFNPPSGMNVPKDTKTTVQFTVDRFGAVTNITLRRSSGNNMWDHLSMRAVQISKVPELPPNYRAPALSLNFNFTPN